MSDVNTVQAPPPGGLVNKGRVKTQFPAPKFSQVRDTDRGLNSHKFFTYWLELGQLPLTNGQPGEKMVDVAEVRVYRCWPVIDLYVIEPGRRNIVFDFIHGACPFKDPHAYPEYFLKHYGAGDWKVIILESGVSAPIMQAVFRARGMEGASEDLDTYPPKLDYRSLKKVDENTSYINWRSRNNLPLPWDQNEDVEGVGEMAMGLSSAPQTGTSMLGEAFRTVADSNARLTDKAIDASERLVDAKLEAIRSDKVEEPSAIAMATTESIKLMSDSARAVMGMVTEHSGKQYDPVQMLNATAAIFEKRGGDHDGLDKILSMVQNSNDRVIGMYAKQAEFMEKLVLARNGDGSYGPESAPEKPRSLTDQITEFRMMAETMGWQKPGSSNGNAVAAAAVAAAGPEKPSWFNENTAPIVMMGVQTVFVLVANIVHNWAAVKFQVGAPQKPEEALQKAQTTMRDMQAAANGEAPEPVAADPAAQERAGWQNFIEEFTGPFINHLFTEGCNGYSLAMFLQSDGTMAAMTPNGRKNYLALKTRLGPQGFEALCRGHQPLWSKCGGHPHVRRFIKEFMDFDAHQEELRRKAAAESVPPVAA
jgi:hypothetical protein